MQSRTVAKMIDNATIPVWVTSVDYAGGPVAFGRGETEDGARVDFAVEPRALWAISEALAAGDGPVLAAIPTWWSIIGRASGARQGPGGMGLAEWLGAQMLERRLSQRQVALRAGVDHGTVSRLLAGRVPTGRTLARLARVFGWPPLDAVDHRITARGSDRPAENEDAARSLGSGSRSR